MNEICTFKNEVNSRLQNRFDTLQRKANILLTDTAINTDISMSNAIFKIKYDDVTDDDENEDLIINSTTATSKSQNAPNFSKKLNKSLSNQDVLINRFLSSKKNQSYTPLNVPVVESPSSTASHYTSNCSSSANQIPALTLLRDRLDRTLNSSNISLATTDSVQKYNLSKSKPNKKFAYQRLNETPEELNEHEHENVFKRIFARNDFNQQEELILPELNTTSSSFGASTGSSKMSVGEGNSASESISNTNFSRNYFEPIQKEFRTTPIPKDKHLIMSSLKASKKQPIKKQPVYDFGLRHHYSVSKWKYNYVETSDSAAIQNEDKLHKKLHKEPSSSKSKPKYDSLKLRVMPLKRNASEIATCPYQHETPQLNSHFYAHMSPFSSRQTPYYQTTTTTTYNCPCCTRLNSLNAFERNSLIRNNSFTSSDSDKMNLVMNIKDKRYRSASKNGSSRLADEHGECRCHSTQRYTTSKKIYRNEHGYAASEKKNSDRDEEFKLDSINFRNIFKKYNDELIPELGRERNVRKSGDKNILNSYYDLNDDNDSEIDQEMVSKEIEITLNSLHRPHSAVLSDYKENELTSSSNYLNTNVYNSYILNDSSAQKYAKDISIPKKVGALLNKKV
jgi:hypothetical protein